MVQLEFKLNLSKVSSKVSISHRYGSTFALGCYAFSVLGFQSLIGTVQRSQNEKNEYCIGKFQSLIGTVQHLKKQESLAIKALCFNLS